MILCRPPKVTTAVPGSAVRGHARIVDMVTAITSSWIASIAVALALEPGQPPSRRMADGKVWTTRNSDVDVSPSYCYDDAEANCRRYGRLYTWESAQRACRALGDGWRLPTNDEWRGLATAYGGLREETADKGRAAYDALIAGGRSGFEAVFGGGRDRTASTRAATRTGSTGRPRRRGRTRPGSTTSGGAASPSIVTPPARSRGPSPSGASAISAITRGHRPNRRRGWCGRADASSRRLSGAGRRLSRRAPLSIRLRTLLLVSLGGAPSCAPAPAAAQPPTPS